MSEVRRWKLKGFIPGIEGETKAVFQPTVVLAGDYDALKAERDSALTREAALREDLESAKDRVFCLDTQIASSARQLIERDQMRDALQQRLTAAEKKLGEAMSIVSVYKSGLGFNRESSCSVNMWNRIERLEGSCAGSECKSCQGEGVTHTGIEESPTTLCGRFDGEGVEKRPTNKIKAS